MKSKLWKGLNFRLGGIGESKFLLASDTQIDAQQYHQKEESGCRDGDPLKNNTPLFIVHMILI